MRRPRKSSKIKYWRKCSLFLFSLPLLLHSSTHSFLLFLQTTDRHRIQDTEHRKRFEREGQRKESKGDSKADPLLKWTQCKSLPPPLSSLPSYLPSSYVCFFLFLSLQRSSTDDLMLGHSHAIRMGSLMSPTPPALDDEDPHSGFSSPTPNLSSSKGSLGRARGGLVNGIALPRSVSDAGEITRKMKDAVPRVGAKLTSKSRAKDDMGILLPPPPISHFPSPPHLPPSPLSPLSFIFI